MLAKAAGAGIALLAIFVTLAGCSSTAAAAGWAGGTVSGSSVYTVSSQGQLVAMTTAETQEWAAAVEGTAASGGFLGCSAPSTLVAVYGTPAIAGDSIYVAGYNGKIYSYSISKQSENTNVTLDKDDPKSVVGGITANGGKIFVGSSNGNLYALDGATLSQDWKFSTGSKIWCTPAVDNGTVFIGSFDKKIYAVDETTGAKKWSYDVQGAVVSTPVIAGGVVYVASFDRKIYALDEATGSLKWVFPTPGQSGGAPRDWFWATPVISGGILYAPCMDGKVYTVNIKDGTPSAVFDLGAAISSSPVIAGGTVVVATEAARIFSLDAAKGTKVLLVDLRLADSESKLTVNSQLSALGNTVFIHGLQVDKMYALDITTDKFVAFALGSVATTSTAVATQTATVTATVTVATTITATK
jgi:outer membrane protein assembly factor BamB